MDFSKIIFIAISGILFIIIPMFIKNVKQYFLALSSFLYIFSSGWIFYHFNGLMLADLPIVGLLVLGFFSSRRIKWIIHPICLPVIGFILWGIISSFTAVSQGWALSELTKYVRMYFLVIALYHNIQSLNDLKVVVLSMVGGLLFESLLGVYQWRFGSLGIWYLGERDAWRIRWRSMGTFYVPSFYANYLAMVLPTAYRLFVFYKNRIRNHMVLFGSALFFGLIALFSTYGRAPWVGFGLAAVLLTFVSVVKTKFRAKLNWAIPLVFVFSLFFLQRYGAKVIGQFQQRQASVDVRFPQFRIARRMIGRNPLMGVGLGNYELVSENYMTEAERSHIMARVHKIMVHNSYYLIASEMGLPGVILVIAWFLSMFFTGFIILKSQLYHSFILNITLGALGGMVAIITVFTFSPDIHAYQLQYQIGLFSAILLASRKILNDAKLRQIKSLKMKKRSELKNVQSNENMA